MQETHRIARVDFRLFKAFERFTVHIKPFNILVGPNNAGKSTILASFRILAAALRKANSKRPVVVTGPGGSTFGYIIDLDSVSVAGENIFFNYDDSEPASVQFTLSNKGKLILYFPQNGKCILVAESDSGVPRTPSAFRKQFNCPIGFVPILGPVDHNELLFLEQTARNALYNYTAARNFRNIWHHFPEKFEEFRQALRESWPGMDIEPPVIDYSHEKPRLHMFCPEDRIPREICWAGFGFQVWCQMLTHLVQSSNKALFLIDEPDIYLHSELQRQLLGLLRNLGPDILIATHSIDLITEAEPDDIVLINKKQSHAKRIHKPSELSGVLSVLGSNLNPVLTQLAKTRRVVFVEGKDFQVIAKFARKLRFTTIGNRTGFAVVPVEGFNPERIRNFKLGMEKTLGSKILAAAILDRDYRSDDECKSISQSCKKFVDIVRIHNRKEIENYLLLPDVIDRAAAKKAEDRARRQGLKPNFEPCTRSVLEAFFVEIKTHVTSRFLAQHKKFAKSFKPGVDDATLNEEALKEFEVRWADFDSRIQVVPGKRALGVVNEHMQKKYGITVTPVSIIEAMKADEFPEEMKTLVSELSGFTKKR